MLPPILPGSHETGFSEHPKRSTGRANEKIASVVNKLLTPGDMSSDVMRKTIEDAFKLSVPDLMQSSDLNELESAIQHIYDKHCSKGVVGFIKSISGHTLEGQCTSILQSIHTAKIESEQEFHELVQSNPLLRNIKNDSERVEIVDILKELPRAERAEFVEQLQVLLEGVEDSEDRSAIVYTIKRMIQEMMSPAERAELVGQVKPLLVGVKDKVGLSLMLSELRAVPRDERVDLLNKMQPWLKEFPSMDDRRHLLSSVSSIRPEERADVLRVAESFLKKPPNNLWSILMAIEKRPQAERRDFARQLWAWCEGVDDIGGDLFVALGGDIPINEKVEMLQLAYPLLVGVENGDKRSALLDSIRQMPKDEKMEVLSRVKLLLKGLEDNSEGLAILQVIRDMPRAERAEFVIQVQPLLVGITRSSERAIILNVISNIPQPARAEFARLAQSLQGRIASSERTSMLYRISGMHLAERAEFVRLAQLLLGGIRNGGEMNILDAISSIPPAERTEFARQVQPLLNGIADVVARSFVLYAIKEFAPTERAEFVRLAQLLFAEIGDVVERKRVLEIVGNVKGVLYAERAECEKLAQPLQRILENDRERKAILQVILETPKAERAEFARLAQSWLTGVENGRKRSTILQAILDISQTGRMEVLRLAQPLQGILETSNEQILLLFVLSAMPQDERAEFARLAQSLLTGVEDISERRVILKAILNLPKAESRGVLRLAQSLLTGVEEGEDRIEILQLISDLPQAERGEFVSKVQSLLAGIGRIERSAILGIIGEIPKAEKREVLRQAQLVLTRTGSGIGRAEILQLIKDMPRTEREAFVNQLQLLLTGFGSRFERIEILQLIRGRPQIQRAGLVTALSSLIDGVDISQQAQLLLHVRRLPARQLYHAIELVTSFSPEQRLVEMEQIHPSGRDFGASEDGKYRIAIDRKELTESPRTVLHNFTEQFNHKVKSELGVTFLGEPGVDASGLSREFISLLFDGLKDKMKFTLLDNGLYRPLLPVDAVMSDEDKLSYNELGKLMLFCLAAVQDYPIGMIFDESVFIALKALVTSSSLDSGEFTFDELFAVYTLMNSNNDDDTAKIRLMNESLASCVDEASLQEARSDILDGYVQPVLAPLIEIAKGLKNAPFNKDALNLDATLLSEKLQGKVTREYILSKLEFTGFSDEKATWMRNWISNTSNEKIRQFLHAMTGASALGKANLKIADRGENIHFHTCFNSLDIPLDAIENEEMLHSLIESTIGGRERYTHS